MLLPKQGESLPAGLWGRSRVTWMWDHFFWLICFIASRCRACYGHLSGGSIRKRLPHPLPREALWCESWGVAGTEGLNPGCVQLGLFLSWVVQAGWALASSCHAWKGSVLQGQNVSRSHLYSQYRAGYLPESRLDKNLPNEWMYPRRNERKDVNSYLWSGSWNLTIVSPDRLTFSTDTNYLGVRGFKIMLWRRGCERDSGGCLPSPPPWEVGEDLLALISMCTWSKERDTESPYFPT